MPDRTKQDAQLALRHAPVLLQKVHAAYPRADFIARVDFARPWARIHENWKAPWEKTAAGKYKHRLEAAAYYSVVETHTHRFLAYAFYHPQDWSNWWGNPGRSSPRKIDQHLHDMEGALAVIPKRANPAEERVEAVITISHFHFYSHAGWEDGRRRVPGPFRITGWTENLDGPIRVTNRFAGESGEPPYRFKLYSASGSHAILGLQKGWGEEDRIVRYRPSRGAGQEPSETAFTKEGDARFQTVRYRLVSLFEAGGLWDQRENRNVFQTNEMGQEAFAQARGAQRVPGSANPPWGWDDRDDRHKAGQFAWDPAALVADYFAGLREFSGEYVVNPYLGIG